MNDRDLENLWDELSNIPVNNESEIEQDFHIFKKGDAIESVWAYFDHNHSKGVMWLMYGDKN